MMVLNLIIHAVMYMICINPPGCVYSRLLAHTLQLTHIYDGQLNCEPYVVLTC
jgi:hypothetical protein